tara:strand:- start:707 stop:1273 length:567 start_codon:yes stop_codon:yes gene_type:complete
MGRRAKRAEPETFLRQRIESLPSPGKVKSPYQDHNGKIKMGKASAIQEWAEVVFKKRHSRYPSQIEVCSAVDSGEVGNWIASQYKKEIIDAVIVLNGREIPKAKYIAKGKEMSKPNDSFRKEMEEARKERRERRWKQESITETVNAVVGGQIHPSDTSAMEVYNDKLFADKKNKWECDRILDKASKRK